MGKNLSRNKKIVFGIGILLGVAVLILGVLPGPRAWVMRLVGRDRAPSGDLTTVLPPQPPVPPAQSQPAAGVPTAPPPSLTPPAAKTRAPVYTGRDPAEIRISSEVTRDLSQAQKEKMLDEIRRLGADVKSNPSLYSSWMQIALLKKNIGDYEGARDAWEYASALYPKSNVPFMNLGELYWHYLPNYPLAEKNFRLGIAKDSLSTAGYITLSDFYSLGYKEKANLALGVLMEGLKAHPNDSNLTRAIAWYYQRAQDYPHALLWWEKVQAAEPNNQSVRDTIAEMRKKIGSQ